MREVVFYHVGEIPSFMGKMIGSVKKHLDLPLTQLTDTKTDAIEGVDRVVRTDYGGYLSADRIYHMRDYPHDELLMLDTDVLVVKNVEHIFDQDFDVALTHRSSFEPGGKANIERGEPYNTGVVFSKSNDFWQKCAQWCDKASDRIKSWGAEQQSINAVALKKKNGFRVLNLKCDEYNWSPQHKGQQNERAHIYHFKGEWHKRKPWMLSDGYNY